MLAGPWVGFTASTTVSALAAPRAFASMSRVIEAVVLGLTSSNRTPQA
jgi:hypothetical protein